MPRPRIQKQLVPVPLTSGLSQREDPAHLQPGQAIQITNYVKGKQSTLEKSPGYTSLSLTPSAGANVSYVAAVAAHKSGPLVVATDTSDGPGLYAYSDSNVGVSLIDRVSEVFVPTPQQVVAYQQPMTELDVAVLAPAGVPVAVVHVWTVDPTSAGNAYRVYYTVRDYATGATIVPAQEVGSLTSLTGHPFVAPKIITSVASGTTVACTLFAGLSSTNTLYVTSLNLTTYAWGTASALVTDIQNESVYDVAYVDDVSSQYVLAYERSSSRQLVVTRFTGVPPSLTVSGTFADTTWSSGTDHITGFAVRASNASGAVWIAYAWSHGSGTSIVSHVQGGAVNYPSMSGAFCSTISLLNGMTMTYPGPQLLDIKECRIVGGVREQQVVWSPPNTKVGYDPAYVATPATTHPNPLTAIYQAVFWSNSGTGTLENNQPRWTNGVTLASRMFPYQLSQGLGNSNGSTGQCFVVGFMPSNNLNPTWSGVNTVAAPLTTNVYAVPYASNVSFSNGRAYGNGASGGAQAQMLLSETIPAQFSVAPISASNIAPRPFPPANVVVANVPITEPGSGYTLPPTATLSWGIGSLLSTFIPNSSGMPASGILGGININPALLNPANIRNTGGVINVSSAFTMFTPEMLGVNITVSNCSNAIDNGTFTIIATDTTGTICTIRAPGAVTELSTPLVTVDNNSGSGLNYDTQPNAVPVWVEDMVSGIVYTQLATATIDTVNGNVTGVTLTGAGANANIHTSSLAWIPQPTIAGGNYNGTTTTTTTLVQSPGYENIQGTFFLFSMDTFADVTTPNDTGTPYRNTPMRLVATLKPRLGLNSIMSSAHTLPHMSQVWPLGVPSWGPPVFDLPINVSPTSVGIMQFQPQFFPSWAITAPMYQGDELGGLTALCSGEPTLTDGAHISEFAYPYFPENLYVYASGPFAPGSGIGQLYPGSSYQYIATYERMDSVGNTHRSGRSVPVELITLPTYDQSTYSANLVIPTMGFSPSHHGVNQTNLANVPTQTPSLIQLYRTTSPGSTAGGTATTGGTVFQNLSATSQGIVQNDLWSPYIFYRDGVTGASADGPVSVNPLLYGDGSNGTDPGSILDNLTPPALQGLIVHKNRFWGFEGSNVWYTKSFTSGEGPGFNEQFAFSVDDGSGDITALASMDERLLVFKRDRIFYVVGDGPNDNLSSNDLQPPQRIQSDVGAINQAGIIVAPSGVYFLSDDGLYQVTRKFDVAHYGSFVDDWITQYPVITSGTLDPVNGRLVWIASKPNTGSVTPGAVIVMYSYLWDAWTVERLDQGAGNYTNFQVTSAKVTGTPPALTVGGNYANTGGPFVLRESTSTYTVPNSSGAATYQQSVWQSPWLKAQDFQGFGRWMGVTLSWYNSDTNALQVQFDYNYSTAFTQTQTISASAMLASQKAGSPYPIVQWELQPNFAKAESFRVTITDMKDSVSAPVTGRGSILLGLTVTMGLKDGTKTFPLPVTQRGTA